MKLYYNINSDFMKEFDLYFLQKVIVNNNARNLDSFKIISLKFLIFILTSDLFYNTENKSSYKFKSNKITIKNINFFLSSHEKLDGLLFNNFKLKENLKLVFTQKDMKELCNTINNYKWSLNEFSNDNEINPNILSYFIEFFHYKLIVKNKNLLKSRKSKGLYFTPILITNYIINQCITNFLSKRLAKDLNSDFDLHSIGKITSTAQINRLIDVLDSIKILDPACGTGQFLLTSLNYELKLYSKLYETLFNLSENEFNSFYFRMKRFYENLGIEIDKDQVAKTDLLKNSYFILLMCLNRILKNINGVDIDFCVQNVAKARIWCFLSFNANKISNVEFINNFFSEINIKTKDFLLDKSSSSIRYDIIIGNPPYIRSRLIKPEKRKLYSKTYKLAIRTYDIYVIFLEKSLDLLKKKGLIGFILPFSFLNQPYASKLRAKLINSENYTLKEVVDIQQDIFLKANVSACILILENSQTNNSLLELKILKENQFNLVRKIDYETYWNLSPHYLFKLELNRQTSEIVNVIEKNSVNFKKILYVSKGVEVFQKNGKKKKKDFIYDKKLNNYKHYIEGKDLARYKINWRGLYLDYNPKSHYSAKFPELFENTKIIMRRIIGKNNMVATIDYNKFYVENTVICLLPKSSLSNIFTFSNKELELSLKYPLELILAIINSKLMQFYFKIKWSDNLQIYNYIVELLPIPKLNDNLEREVKIIIDIVKKILNFNEKNNTKQHLDSIKELEDELDNKIFYLYSLDSEAIGVIKNYSN